MIESTFFGPGTLAFLAELSDNNDRAWFEANRERYESLVREPARGVHPRDGAAGEQAVEVLSADDRKQGGSLTRVYRSDSHSLPRNRWRQSSGKRPPR